MMLKTLTLIPPKKRRPALVFASAFLLVALAVFGTDRLVAYQQPQMSEPAVAITMAGVGIRDAVWAPDGRHIAASFGDAIWTAAADGKNARPVTSPSKDRGAERDAAWSPDGKAIAFSAETNGEWDIWMVSSDGGSPKRVTSLSGDERWPSFTHDGRLVFSHRAVSSPFGVWQLFIVNANGSGDASKLTQGDAAEWEGRVSPDGTSIAFISPSEPGADTSDVWVRGLPAKNTPSDAPNPVVRLTKTAGSSGFPSWSPDGRGLAYFAERGNQVGVWTIGVPADASSPIDDAPKKLGDSAGIPSWSPDGSALMIAGFPRSRAAYNGDARRNDDDPPMFAGAELGYILTSVDLATGTKSQVDFGSGTVRVNVPEMSVFDEVWQTLKALYYKAGDSANAWDKLRDKYRSRAQGAAQAVPPNDHALEDTIDQMIAEQPLIKHSAKSSKAVATSGNPLASQAGAEILSKGGNIVDAAIAVCFALGVVEPDASSVGGDGMAILFMKGMSAPVAIDYKDMSVAAVATRAQNAPRAPDGPAVTNIPGVVAGMDLLYQKYGSHKVSWAEIIAPAIKLADEGFTLDEALPTTITEGRAQFSKYPESVKVFMPGGKIPRPGDRFVNKDYANTLRIIATEGADSFYRGSLAKKIAADFAANGGLMTEEDLAQYHAVERVPLSGHYRGNLVYSAPPPIANGAQMIETLQILDNYKPKPGASYSNDADFLHYAIDAWRARDGGGRIGDPDKMTVDLGNHLDPSHALDRFKLIDPIKAMPAGNGRGGGTGDLGSRPRGLTPEIDGDLESHDDPNAHIQTGTTSYAVADADGDMIVFTQTLSTWGGGFYVSKDLGFLYNDHGRNGGGQAHTRSSSTSVPTMLFAPAKTPDENRFGIPGFVPKMATGCAGNSWIPASVYDIILNVIDSGMDAQHAIEGPRMLIGTRTQIEDRIPRAILADLEARGHQFQKIGRKGEVRQGYASVVIVDVDAHTVEAGAEPRRSHGAVGIK